MTRLQLDCFLAAAGTGSFAAAARELYISPQIVSQHILRLEKELDLRLFDRARDGVTITEDGRRLLRFSERWIGLFNDTKRSILSLYEALGSTLRIGLSEYIDAVGRIAPALSDYAAAHPQADVSGVQYSNRDIQQAVADGRIDVALLCDMQIVSGGDFEIEPFAAEELCLYIAGVDGLESGLTAEDERVKSLCRTLPHLGASYGPWDKQEWTEIEKRMNAHLGVSFGEHRILPNFRSVIACANTLPCTVVCDARFGFLRESDRLRRIPLNVRSSLCCVWSRSNENPLAADLVRFLKDYYR